MLNMKDLYWVAGLIEGEGSFGLRAKYMPLIQVGMTDRDIIERARNILSPTSRVYVYAGKEHREGWSTTRKPLYSTQVVGTRAAGWMMALFPLMSGRRQAAIKKTLAAWKSRPSRNQSKVVCKRGHPYDETNTIITNKGRGRWCRECQRLHGRTRRETLPEAKRLEYQLSSRDANRRRRAAFIGPRRPAGRHKEP